MANFVYVVVEEKSKDALVVDSGWETGPIEEAVRESGAFVRYCVATHEHFDHVSTLSELATRLGAKVVAHEDSPIECDLRVRDGVELFLGGKAVRVLHTPGHTEDSICLFDGHEVFTGDTLFVGTIGRFERERAEAMYNSLHNVVLRLPPATVIYPGHDYGDVPSRTLAEERAVNPYLMVKDVRSFLSLFA
ncbi:MAG: MBL fold metallo-hydrolase [Thaumarchaeota archaeon]|nr:MBL fold metallo-hydrolase [Nitrososphaerota archaeon]